MSVRRADRLQNARRAAESGDLEYFEALLSEHDWRYDPDSAALLYLAAEYGSETICALFLDRGFDPNLGYERFTALCGAAASGNREVIRRLLDAGAQVDGNADTVTSPLLEAIRHRHPEAARLLLEHGAGVNRCHRWSGETPLDAALEYCQRETARLLRQQGGLSGWEIPPAVSSPEGKAVYGRFLERCVRVFPVGQAVRVGGNRIDLWTAMDKKQRKYLFSTGVSAFTKPKCELFLVLPFEWEFSCEGWECFWTELLRRFAEQLKDGAGKEELRLSPGGKSTAPVWPRGTMGLCAPDPDWPPVLTETHRAVCFYEVSLIHAKGFRRERELVR